MTTSDPTAAAYASAIKAQDAKFAELGLKKTIVNAEQVCVYSRGLGSASEDNPVLVLLHGYPQSSYLWRHFIKHLAQYETHLPHPLSLFVPDLPGYGASAPIKTNDKLSVGTVLLSALKTEVRRSSTITATSPIPVILVGHDRGARVAHRLAVSGCEGMDIKGVCLIDIVPTTTQWASLSNSKNAASTFHWPLLANVAQADAMLAAYGGSRWCHDMMHRWAGSNARGLGSLKSDNALEVYGNFFTQPHVIHASNEDYAAGATVDVEMQGEDQREGRKVRVPIFLIYSEGYLGSRYDVPKVWEEWVERASLIGSCRLGEGVGHFGVEEAPEVSARGFWEWLRGL